MAKPKLRLGRIVGSDLFGFLYHYVDLNDEWIQKHKHILGIGGTGKSMTEILMWLTYHRLGIGSTFIDPHGSSAEFLLRSLIGQGFYKNNPQAYERVPYIEYSDGDWMIPNNILKLAWASKYETVKLVIEAFKRVWPELSTASMFDSMMDASLKILIDNDYSIAALFELLSDKDKRITRYYPKAKDEMALSWFRTRWDTLPLRDQMIEGGSIIRRAYLIASSPVAQLTLGQGENRVNQRDYMDQERSPIVNLGRIKDGETRKLIGAIWNHSAEIAAMSRLPRTDLPQHQLIIDEFSQFAAQSSESLATMLDQTRKANLFVTMAGQTFSQLSTTNHPGDRLIGALANALVKISFQVGQQDAMIQAKIFADYDPLALKKEAAFEKGQPLLMSPQDQYEAWAQALKTLKPRHALVRVGSNKAVEIETTPVPTFKVSQEEIDSVKQQYFERYYTRRDEIILPHQAPWNDGKPPQRIKE